MIDGVSNIEGARSYLFVFAHPDDEVYTAGLMHRLIAAGKSVNAAYLTSGDGGANAAGREQELERSMGAIGVVDGCHVLRIPESDLLEQGNLTKAVQSLALIAVEEQVECVVGMEYEGGHIGHDASHVLTSVLTKLSPSPSFFTFPVYHLENGQRRAGFFEAGLEPTDQIDMDTVEKQVKAQVLAAHASQADHFRRLSEIDPAYLTRLFEREVYRRVTTHANFSRPPANEIGYARSGNTFDDFAHAAEYVSRIDVASLV